MPYFATTYRYTDDVPRRDEVRPTHRDYLAGLTAREALAVSGPYADGEPGGALLIFSADTADEARALVDSDPFVVEGLVAEITIREWKPVSGALGQHF